MGHGVETPAHASSVRWIQLLPMHPPLLRYPTAETVRPDRMNLDEKNANALCQLDWHSGWALPLEGATRVTRRRARPSQAPRSD